MNLILPTLLDAGISLPILEWENPHLGCEKWSLDLTRKSNVLPTVSLCFYENKRWAFSQNPWMVSLGWYMWGNNHFLLALEKDTQGVTPIMTSQVPWKDKPLKGGPVPSLLPLPKGKTGASLLASLSRQHLSKTQFKLVKGKDRRQAASNTFRLLVRCKVKQLLENDTVHWNKFQHL